MTFNEKTDQQREVLTPEQKAALEKATLAYANNLPGKKEMLSYLDFAAGFRAVLTVREEPQHMYETMARMRYEAAHEDEDHVAWADTVEAVRHLYRSEVAEFINGAGVESVDNRSARELRELAQFASDELFSAARTLIADGSHQSGHIASEAAREIEDRLREVLAAREANEPSDSASLKPKVDTERPDEMREAARDLMGKAAVLLFIEHDTEHPERMSEPARDLLAAKDRVRRLVVRDTEQEHER